MVATLLKPEIGPTKPIEARDSLAFLLRKSVSLCDIAGLQRQIKDNSDLAYKVGNEAVKTMLTQNLKEGLGELATIIRNESGTLWLSVPDELVRYTRAQDLIDEYGQAVNEATDHLLAVPLDRVTAANGLPLYSANNGYDPSLDLRIQTSKDPALKTLVAPGTVELSESPGTWHRFPLGQVALGHVADTLAA